MKKIGTIPVNPVRKSSTFQRGGSHGALNPVFALKGIIYSSPLQAAGLSNGVNMQKAIRVKHYSLSTERAYMDWVRRFFDYAGNMKGGLLRETPGAEDIRSLRCS